MTTRRLRSFRWNPTRNDAVETDWPRALPYLRCVGCGAGPVEVGPGDTIICTHCQRNYVIQDQIWKVTDEPDGNNKIAATFYDGPQWKKYRFWKQFTPFNERAVTLWRSEVLRHLPDLAGTALLDIAIGDGHNLPLMSEECDVFGVDISIAQLHVCRDSNSTHRLWLCHGIAEQLPFLDHVFDNVLSFGAFNYFNDPLASLREMSRVVKPGGLVVITDEYPDLPKNMIGHRLGWPALDRWILSKFLHLGNDFADMIERHRNMKIEPIIGQVFQSWEMSDVCNQAAYCVVARAN
jgi:ubiquinone/menaquinone biosynthesis C-methylase UbiE